MEDREKMAILNGLEEEWQIKFLEWTMTTNIALNIHPFHAYN